MSVWGFPDAASEEALHKSRVLNVEEKPFRRLTKRLLADPSPLFSLLPNKDAPSTPSSPDTSTPKPSDDPSSISEKAALLRREFREDVLLDFAAFESSIVRIQFLRQSNAAERDRYAGEKTRIEDTAEGVRDSTTRLRTQLEDSQQLLATRKTYDALADEITGNRALKSRDEQQLEIEKLRAEVEELEVEGKEFEGAWRERREQFKAVQGEGDRLRRLIRDEKEVEEVEGEEMLGVEHGRGGRSNIGTPRILDDGGSTPLRIARGGTPISRSGTPMPEQPGGEPLEDRVMPPITEMQEDMADAKMEDESEVDQGSNLQASSQVTATQRRKQADSMDIS